MVGVVLRDTDIFTRGDLEISLEIAPPLENTETITPTQWVGIFHNQYETALQEKQYLEAFQQIMNYSIQRSTNWLFNDYSLEEVSVKNAPEIILRMAGMIGTNILYAGLSLTLFPLRMVEKMYHNKTHKEQYREKLLSPSPEPYLP